MRLLTIVLSLLALAACSTLNIDTAQRPHALDAVNDDVASLLIALDLPYGLAPLEGASTMSFLARSPNGERHVKATLVRADVEDLAGALPPPSPSRVYFLFSFSDADKAALHDMQGWARTQPRGSVTSIVGFAPRFCKMAPVDPASTSLSVLITLPGDNSLAPLIDRQKLSEALGGKPLENCR